jgi:hypothetical protein
MRRKLFFHVAIIVAMMAFLQAAADAQECVNGRCYAVPRIIGAASEVVVAVADLPVRIVEHAACEVQGIRSGVSTGLAQWKAERQAAEGRMRHVGGGFGGGRYEGVGFSTYSSDSAIRACCYWGKRPVREIGVARGRSGWFATVIYE